MKNHINYILGVFIFLVGFNALASDISGSGSAGRYDAKDPRQGVYVPPKTASEVKEKYNCPNEPDISKSAVAECVKGVYGSIKDTFAMPFKAFAQEQECYYNTTYKQGLLSVVAPLLVADSAVEQNYNYANWPQGAAALMENNGIYQSYLRQGCTQIMRTVHSMERRTLATIHDKKIKQRDYDRYLASGRSQNARAVANANRRWPLEQRILSPKEDAFQRVYDERKRFADSMPKGPNLFKQIACMSGAELWGLGCSIAGGFITPGGVLLIGAKAAKVARSTKSLRGSSTADNIAARAADEVVPESQLSIAGRNAQGAGDSLESRRVLATEALKADGLLPPKGTITDRQANAVWEAHKLPDDQITQKGLILREAGFKPDQIRAIVKGRDELGGRGIAGGYQASSEAAGVVANSGNDVVGLSDIAKRTVKDLDRRGNPKDLEVLWHRAPGIRGDTATEIRRRVNSGAVIENKVQRDEMRRVLGIDAHEQAAGRPMKYGDLETYYTRMGYKPGWPASDADYVEHLTRSLTEGSNKFMLQARAADSKMAIHQMQERARILSDPNRARGLGMDPSDAASEARQLLQRAEEIERKLMVVDMQLSQLN